MYSLSLSTYLLLKKFTAKVLHIIVYAEVAYVSLPMQQFEPCACGEYMISTWVTHSTMGHTNVAITTFSAKPDIQACQVTHTACVTHSFSLSHTLTRRRQTFTL